MMIHVKDVEGEAAEEEEEQVPIEVGDRFVCVHLISGGGLISMDKNGKVSVYIHTLPPSVTFHN